MLAVCVASGALVGQYWGCSLLETLPEGPSNEALLLITVMHVVNTNLARLLNLSIRGYKMVLGVLLAAKHKSLKRWKVVDNDITDSLNEAKDNVKYLSTLETYQGQCQVSVDSGDVHRSPLQRHSKSNHRFSSSFDEQCQNDADNCSVLLDQ